MKGALQYMRNEVARLLCLQGVDLGQNVGGDRNSAGATGGSPVASRRHHATPQSIELHEPPTYIRFVSEEEREITFYSEQRRIFGSKLMRIVFTMTRIIHIAQTSI